MKTRMTIGKDREDGQVEGGDEKKKGKDGKMNEKIGIKTNTEDRENENPRNSNSDTKKHRRKEVEKLKSKTHNEKDYSKLCNRYVWNGECFGQHKWCKYTHKKLCRQLRREGECTRDNCWMGTTRMEYAKDTTRKMAANTMKRDVAFYT